MIQTLAQIVGIAAVIMTAFALFITLSVWTASRQTFNRLGAQIVATVYSSAAAYAWPVVLWVAFYFLHHKW